MYISMLVEKEEIEGKGRNVHCIVQVYKVYIICEIPVYFKVNKPFCMFFYFKVNKPFCMFFLF